MKTLLHTGNNLNTAQKYENAIWALHPEHGELKTASQMKREMCRGNMLSGVKRTNHTLRSREWRHTREFTQSTFRRQPDNMILSGAPAYQFPR